MYLQGSLFLIKEITLSVGVIMYVQGKGIQGLVFLVLTVFSSLGW